MSATNATLPSSSTRASEETPDISDLRCRARTHVEEAVQAIPLARKEAYVEAKRKCPLLCQTETDPLKFLRACDYNVTAAAERICLYWKERKVVFQERAFLPLLLTGDGALTSDDALFLRAGWPALLPDTTTGKKVVLCDRRQHHPAATTEQRLRCAFYVCNFLAEDVASQTEGVHYLIVGATPRGPVWDMEFVDRCIFLARSVFPMKCMFNYVNLATPSTKRHQVQDIMAANVDIHVNKGSRLDDVEFHFDRESGAVFAELLDLGFTREGIPTFLGGLWSFTSFTDWCRTQTQKERRLQRREPASAGSQDTKGPKLTGQAKADRLRERNLIYSRRKRERRQQELENLQDERDQLDGEKEALLVEQGRLEELLRQAQELVEAAYEQM